MPPAYSIRGNNEYGEKIPEMQKKIRIPTLLAIVIEYIAKSIYTSRFTPLEKPIKTKLN
jgi:hypothetical protein